MGRYGLAMAVWVCACSAIASAAGPVTGRLGPDEVQHYTGDIGGVMPIGARLRFSDGGRTVNGCYFYDKYCKDIRLDGRVDGRDIALEEHAPDGTVTGRFDGRFAEVDPRHRYRSDAKLDCDVIVGEWSKPDGTGAKPFYMTLEFSGEQPRGVAEYGDAGFDCDGAVVDAAMAEFRTAVLKHGPVRTVTDLIDFPIKVTVGGKSRTIESAAGFAKNYDAIFTPGFVAALAASPPHHMFCRDRGVMLGNGQLWMSPVMVAGESVPKITDINNGDDCCGPPVLELNGEWRVTKVAGFARTSALDDAGAAGWIGATLSIDRDRVCFRMPDGSRQLSRPDFASRTVAAGDFADDFRVVPEELGIKERTVSYFDSAGDEKAKAFTPASTLIRRSYGVLICQWDGAFFELRRNDPPVNH